MGGKLSSLPVNLDCAVHQTRTMLQHILVLSWLCLGRQPGGVASGSRLRLDKGAGVGCSAPQQMITLLIACHLTVLLSGQHRKSSHTQKSCMFGGSAFVYKAGMPQALEGDHARNVNFP